MHGKSRIGFGRLLAAVFALLGGCYPSENPVWTPETLVYFPELLGMYRGDGPAAATNTTTLEKGDADKSYRVVTRNGKGEKTGEATLRLVKLDGRIFYDYEPSAAKLDNFRPPLKGLHLFGRLTIKDKTITLYDFGGNVAVDDAFRWKKVTADGEDSRIIANTTRELQAILKANADKMNVTGGTFTRLPDSSAQRALFR